MSCNLRLFVPVLMAGAISFPVCASNADKGFQAALAAPDRPAADKQRDPARRPDRVIEFLGITAGMTVMDVMGGGGYYTEVLSAAVGPQGRVVAQNFDWMLRMREGERARELKERVARLGNVEILLLDFSPARPPEQRLIDMKSVTGLLDLGPVSTFIEPWLQTMDAAITALNLHDMYIYGDEDGAVTFLKNIYRVLRPGGVLGLIDHVGIPGQDNSRLHRIERPLAQRLLVEAGFVIAAESDLLANPEDDHTLNVYDPALQRNTDRMLFRAVKPPR